MTSALRVEARPASWRELYPSQQDAMKQLAGLVHGAVTELDHDSGRSDKLSWVDADKVSRIAFLSGARGTGKTTVLMSLVRAIEAGGMDHLEDRRLAEMLSQCKDRVVWLEPLDAEPETQSTNLLGAIVARVERAIELYAGAFKMPAGGLDATTPFEEALSELRRVQTKMVLARGDGHLSKDVDTLALEVRRREVAKLGLQLDFDDVLRQLGKSVLGDRDPIFVLPVDDVDLNPHLCVELLKLLRAVTVSRLFPVVLGDLALTQLVMQLKTAADFEKTVHGFDWLAVDKPDVQRNVAEVAFHNMRKLIPPQQRVLLEMTRVHEALEARPLGMGLDQALAHRLQGCMLPVDPGYEPILQAAFDTPAPTVLDMLLSPKVHFEVVSTPSVSAARPAPPPAPQTEQERLAFLERCQKRNEQAFYSARNLLRTTPRRLVDLWDMLGRYLASPSDTPTPSSAQRSALLRGVVTHWAELVREDRCSTDDINSELKDLLENDDVRSAEIDRLPFEITPSLGHETEAPLGAGFALQGRLVLRGHEHWQLTAFQIAPADASTDYRQPQKQSTKPLSRAATAAAILAHDLARTNNPPVPHTAFLTKGVPWASTRWLFDSGEYVDVPWPRPPLSTYYQWDRFLSSWSHFVAHTQEDTDRNPGVAWLVCARSSLTGEKPETTLFSLADPNAAALAALQSGSEQVDRAWRLMVGQLLYPEYGLVLPDASTAFAAQLQDDGLALTYLRDLRLRGIRESNRELAQKLEKLASQLSWSPSSQSSA